jgi:translation initiation factor 2 beta subunit (eIF-2beta)/eIF-5
LKIGQERFDQLEARARVTRKFTKDELKELIKKYKEKFVELK